MPPLLKDIDTRLKALLAPLLTINGWEVSDIVTEDFSNNENFNELINKYRSKLPGAFLSFPQITYNAQPVRVPHFTADYMLMIGAESRYKANTVHDFIFEFHDRANHLINLQAINDIDLPCSLNFIRMRTFNFADVDNNSGPLGVALLAFAVEVRNWQINDPA